MKNLELKNIIDYKDKKYLVSTISTPIRHTWFKDDERIVYETMVFEVIGDEIDYENPLFNERYHTQEEAIADHSCIIKNPKVFIH